MWKGHCALRSDIIEWQPAWSVMQSADLTLSAGRGDAMDIASLTLALLRASQIPSRYEHGTKRS